MDEQQHTQEEQELKRPDEAIEDLEPDAENTEGVKGGAVDAFMQLDGISGESKQ